MTEGASEQTTSPTDAADSEIRRCQSCGSPTKYDPEFRSLRCESCGTAEALSVPVIDTHSFERPLQEALSELSYAEETKKIAQCDNCGAQVDFGELTIATWCPFCAHHQVLVVEDYRRRLLPSLVLPFVISEKAAISEFKKWIAGLWFRPNALKRQARSQNLRGMYLPYWTFDAHVDSTWTAESGTYYWEDESYSTFEDGKWVTKTRRVRKVKWRPASGARSDFHDDVLIGAHDESLPKTLFGRIESFDLSALTPYEKTYLAGFAAQEYSVTVHEGAALSVEKMDQLQHGACARDVPGDTHRFLQVNNHYSQQTFKLISLPLWLCAYRYRGKTYRYVVNGQSGETYGEAPYSRWKIALTVIASLAVVIGIPLLIFAMMSQ